MTYVDYYASLYNFSKKNSLQHYGTKGQKWGTRNWQNYDGTFNEAGKQRYFGKKSSENLDEHKLNRKETYYNNRSEEDKRKRNWELIKAGLTSALTGISLFAAESGVLSSSILMGLGPVAIPVIGGLAVAKNLVSAGFNHIDSKYCEKKANEYYDMLKDMNEKYQDKEEE